MNNMLGKLSWLVTVPPAYHASCPVPHYSFSGRRGGAGRAAPERAETLPEGSAIAEAMDEIDDLFGDSSEARVVTLIFRGEALTPNGLSQMDALLEDVFNEPGVGDLLAPVDPIVAPTLLVRALLQVDGFDSVTQARIDSAPAPRRSRRRSPR